MKQRLCIFEAVKLGQNISTKNVWFQIKRSRFIWIGFLWSQYINNASCGEPSSGSSFQHQVTQLFFSIFDRGVFSYFCRFVVSINHNYYQYTISICSWISWLILHSNDSLTRVVFLTYRALLKSTILTKRDSAVILHSFQCILNA